MRKNTFFPGKCVFPGKNVFFLITIVLKCVFPEKNVFFLINSCKFVKTKILTVQYLDNDQKMRHKILPTSLILSVINICFFEKSHFRQNVE